MDGKVHSLLDGQAYAWIEQKASVTLKVASPHGDPVEMTWAETMELGRLLLALADEGETLDQVDHSN